MAIIVSGSLAYDYIMDFPDRFKNHILPNQIHILNVSFVVEKLQKSWGGTAGNIAYTIKMLGGEPIMLSALGTDAADYLSHFAKHQISTQYIYKDETKLSASAYITTDVDDNQITAFYAGPLNNAVKISVPKATQAGQIALISPNSKEGMVKHLREARENGYKVVFDPGQQITVFKEAELQQLIDQSDFLVGNDYEIKLMQERTGWDTQEFLEDGRILITTLGERGSVISEKDNDPIEIKPCAPLSVDDPTGAGDAYRAGFFTAYEKGLDLKTCGQVGAVAASYAVETYGTQKHQFTLGEFCERYFKTYNEKLIL